MTKTSHEEFVRKAIRRLPKTSTKSEIYELYQDIAFENGEECLTYRRICDLINTN